MKDTILHLDHVTAPTSVELDGQSAADLTAIARMEEDGANHSTGATSNVIMASNGAPPAVEPGDARVYGEMTKPDLEAPVGRGAQIANYLTSTVRHVSSGLVTAIRQDPFSAAMVGLGLAWFVAKWWDRKNRPTGFAALKSSGAQSLGRASDNISTSLGTATATTVDQINGMAQQLADVAGTQARHVSQQAQQLGDQAQLLGNQAQDRTKDLGLEIQETVRIMGDRAQDHVNDLRNNAQGQMNRLSCDAQGTSQRLTGSIEKALRQNLVTVNAIGPSIASAVNPVAVEAANLSQKVQRALVTKAS